MKPKHTSIPKSCVFAGPTHIFSEKGSIITVLLITVSIYCYLIKHRAKQKHLLPFHVTNNELKQVMY